LNIKTQFSGDKNFFSDLKDNLDFDSTGMAKFRKLQNLLLVTLRGGVIKR